MSSNSTVDGVYCGSGGGADSYYPLRVASIFIIMATSGSGALFPVLASRTKWLSSRMPGWVYETAKYFGSGVIVSDPFVE